MHFKLSFIERLQLKAHTMVCKACANYEKQSELLETGISRLQEPQITQDDIAELKESIYQKLNKLN
jgi:chaperonin cofactor prefoldin